MMKTLLIIVLAIATVCLAMLCVMENRKSAAQKAQVTALQAQVEQYETQLEGLKNASKYSEKQNTELARVVQAMGGELKKAQAAQTNLGQNAAAAMDVSKGAESGNEAGFGKLLANMMKDPDTKKFIRDQQRLTMDQLYGPLVKKMGLSAEESERFKDLMADNGMRATEKATSLFGGTNRTELVNTLAEEQKKQEEEMKAFLGDTRYEQYKDYQQTVGERTMLNMFRQQNGGEGAMTDPQAEQLLAIMKEEKAAATSAGQTLPSSGDSAAKLQNMLSDEQAEKMLQAQQAANDKVFERASAILSADQLQSFSKFQSNQIQMMRMGMSMARKFMGGDKAP